MTGLLHLQAAVPSEVASHFLQAIHTNQQELSRDQAKLLQTFARLRLPDPYPSMGWAAEGPERAFSIAVLNAADAFLLPSSRTASSSCIRKQTKT